jgi:hypothetical protein
VTIFTLSPLTLPLIEGGGPDDELESEPDSEPDPDCMIVHVCVPAASGADPQQLHVPEMFTLGGDAARAETPNPPTAARLAAISTTQRRRAMRAAPEPRWLPRCGPTNPVDATSVAIDRQDVTT